MTGVTRDGYYIMINRSSLSDQGNKACVSWRVDATAIAANTIGRIRASDRTCIGRIGRANRKERSTYNGTRIQWIKAALNLAVVLDVPISIP
jgi:hypothetical protein